MPSQKNDTAEDTRNEVANMPGQAEQTNVEIPIWGYELEDYINIGTSQTPQWLKITNLLSWEMEDEAETYEPDYIDTSAKKKYTVGNSASISYEKDAYQNNAFDEFLMDNEDKSNVPVEIMRVRTWSKTGNAIKAKKAAFDLTPSQLDKNTSGEPIKLKGELSMSDENWTQGTWNGTAFTVAS